MGMTIAEKILASKSGATRVSPGEIVDAYPDVVMSHTATWRSVSVMRRIGATKLYDPERLAIVLDHVSPAKTEKYAQDQQTSRNFARDYGIGKFYDVDAGIAHLVLMEHGHIKPGDLIVGTDSHCTIYGALGSLGTGIGYTEVTSVWVTGKLWMKVPDDAAVRVERAVRRRRECQGSDAVPDRAARGGWLRLQVRGVLWRCATAHEHLRAHDDGESCNGDGLEMRVRAAR